MVTGRKRGERIFFLRKSGETIEECRRSSVSDGRGVAATMGMLRRAFTNISSFYWSNLVRGNVVSLKVEKSDSNP